MCRKIFLCLYIITFMIIFSSCNMEILLIIKNTHWLKLVVTYYFCIKRSTKFNETFRDILKGIFLPPRSWMVFWLIILPWMIIWRKSEVGNLTDCLKLPFLLTRKAEEGENTLNRNVDMQNYYSWCTTIK